MTHNLYLTLYTIRHFVPFDILSFDILSHSTFCHLTFCPIRYYFYLAFCPIRPFLLLIFCPFDILYHSTFCPFDILYHSTFCHSAFCPIWRFVVQRFVLSAFVTSTFCQWTVCTSVFPSSNIPLQPRVAHPKLFAPIISNSPRYSDSTLTQRWQFYHWVKTISQPTHFFKLLSERPWIVFYNSPLLGFGLTAPFKTMRACAVGCSDF